jgi:hypothetical protein
MLGLYKERTSGTWPSSQSSLTVSGVDIWPSAAAFNDAPCGEEKHLFIITGGKDFENVRTWFQKQAVTFTKTCGK